jgi:hypothetical protein
MTHSLPYFTTNAYRQDHLPVVQDMLAGWRPKNIPPAEGELPVTRVAHI